jgi:hypothetical protein
LIRCRTTKKKKLTPTVWAIKIKIKKQELVYIYDVRGFISSLAKHSKNKTADNYMAAVSVDMSIY